MQVAEDDLHIGSSLTFAVLICSQDGGVRGVSVVQFSMAITVETDN